MTLICLTLVGLLAFRHVDYSNDLWWEFAWRGDAPRFLRASLVLAIVVSGIALDALINRPVQARIGRVEVPDEVRRLIAASRDTMPNMAYLGDKRFLIADDGSAFLMYGITGRSWIALGDPVGDPKERATSSGASPNSPTRPAPAPPSTPSARTCCRSILISGSAS